MQPTSLIKEFLRNGAGPLLRQCPWLLNVSNQRAFLTFQHKYYSVSNTPSLLLSAHSPPQIAEPVNVCNEQCKGCSFSFSLALVCDISSSAAVAAISPTIHHLPPLSLSSMSLSDLHFLSGMGHIW